MENEHLYQKEWQEYRRRRNLSMGTLVLGLFVLFFFVSVLAYIFPESSHLFFPLFFAWPVLSFYFLLQFHNWPCPACGKTFFKMTRWTPNPVMQKACDSCGMEKYSGSRFKR